MIRHLIVLLVITCLVSCNTRQEKIIENRVFRPDLSINYLFDSLSPIQTKIIRNDREITIKGKKGVFIHIPRNSFKNSKGELVVDSIKFEFHESLNVQDMLASNIQTLSNEGILQSSGMIFINALDKNGMPLELVDNKEILIEIPTKYKLPGSKVYSGGYEDSVLIWKSNDSELEKEMIPLPLELFDFNYCAWECGFCEDHIERLISSKNENTYIATREFEIRACVISTTCAGTIGDCEIDTVILKYYLENIDLPLYKVDSMVYDYVFTKYESDYDPNYEWEWDNKTWRNYWIESFEHFYKEHQTFVKQIDFGDIDLGSEEAYDKLVQTGIDKEKASDIIASFNTRQELIKQRKDRERTQRLTSNSFKVSALGWFNIDVLYSNPSAKEIDFTIKLNSDIKIQFATVTLVFPRLNIAIQGFQTDSLIYQFTKDQEGYNKLPSQEKAYVVAFANINDDSYMALEQVELKDSLLMELDLSQTDLKEIERRIKEIEQ